MPPYVIPQTFTVNWQPQVMPATNFALQNNFNNFNLSSLGGGQQYPPMMQQPMQPPMQQPMQPPMQQPMQNYGNQGGYGQQQGGYGQQGGNNNNQFENSGMGMNNNAYGQGY